MEKKLNLGVNEVEKKLNMAGEKVEKPLGVGRKKAEKIGFGQVFSAILEKYLFSVQNANTEYWPENKVHSFFWS